MVKRLPALHPGLQASQVGLHDLAVAVQRKDQGHIDIQAIGNRGLDGRQSLPGGRDLDHHIGSVDGIPQAPRLAKRPFAIVRQFRVHLDRYITIFPVGGFVEPEQDIGRSANIIDHEPIQDALRRPTGLSHHAQISPVGIAARDGLLEDAGIGGDAADDLIGHMLSQCAVFDHVALDVIQPDGLAQGMQFAGAVHSSAPFAQASSSACTLLSRRTCRSSPVKPAPRKACTISTASAEPITLAPSASTFT